MANSGCCWEQDSSRQACSSASSDFLLVCTGFQLGTSQDKEGIFAFVKIRLTFFLEFIQSPLNLCSLLPSTAFSSVWFNNPLCEKYVLLFILNQVSASFYWDVPKRNCGELLSSYCCKVSYECLDFLFLNHLFFIIIFCPLGGRVFIINIAIMSYNNPGGTVSEPSVAPICNFVFFFIKNEVWYVVMLFSTVWEQPTPIFILTYSSEIHCQL